MKKILFIINKTSDERYKECIEAINALKRPLLYSLKFASYTVGDVFTTSDAYLALYEKENPDISIIMDDTVLFVNENLLRDIVKIFKTDPLARLIGVKGAKQLPDSGIIDEADSIYGGLYEMNPQGEVFEKKYNNAQAEFASVEAVSSTMVAIKGYIPIWRGIGNRYIGEILSVATAIQGYKVVVSRDSNSWCFTTIYESKPTEAELKVIKDKYKFKNILFDKNQCILTIGIPTFNRSRYFRKCISNLYKNVGDMPWVEIFVSNNDSTDETEEVVAQYFQHKNFRYYKQPVNIRGKNFDYLYENAKGDFVVACGDDDYYSAETILNLLEAICLHPDSTLIELEWPSEHTSSAILPGNGIDEFLVKCTTLYTCISCIVLNQKKYMAIEVKDRFSHTHLNQCYVQLEMIRKDPQFMILRGDNFLLGSGEATAGRKFKENERHPFCDIFVREYYPILDYFLDKGLSREAYEEEKLINLNKVLSWLNTIKKADDTIQWLIDEDIYELIEEFYGYEPYYEDLKEKIDSILAS